MNSLKEKYQKEIKPKLISEFKLGNSMETPSLEKVVVNIGLGEAIKDKKVIETVSADLAKITGQKPSVREARISVAGFGVREGMPIGLKITLRGARAYNFIDKVFSIVLPRLRDFKGISRGSFDKNGNYTLGISEYTVFPEIDLAKVDKMRGLEITIVTKMSDKEKSIRLLELLGAPFAKENDNG